MLELTPSTSSSSPYNPKCHLRQLRRIAKIRGFRILKDWTDSWSLVDTRIAPPRTLIGLWQVDLVEIDLALSTPPPAPKTRTRKPKVETVQSASPEIVDAEFKPFEPAPVEPLSTIEFLQEQFDLQAVFEKLNLLKTRGR